MSEGSLPLDGAEAAPLDLLKPTPSTCRLFEQVPAIRQSCVLKPLP